MPPERARRDTTSLRHQRQSGHPSQAAEPVLALTDRAVEMLQQALAQTDMHASGIRLTGAGGDCKGFQYSQTPAEAAHPDDAVIVQDGVTGVS